MKTRYILIVAAAIVTGLCIFNACSKDDPEKAHSGKQTGFDDLDYFRSCIAWKDSTGTIRRQYGEVLYNNSPEHLYIGVDSYEEAEALFLGWVAPGSSAVRDALGKGWVYNMTNLDRKSQGSVSLVPGTAPSIAEVTASAGTDLGVFERITFLSNSAWPVNSEESPYQLGDIVVINVQGLGSFNGICIREKGKGVSGLVLAITKEEFYGGWDRDDKPGMMEDTFLSYGSHNKDWVNKYCPNKSDATALASILATDWDFFEACFDDAGEGQLRKGWNYWTEEWDWKLFYNRRWAMVLSTPNSDGLEWFDVDWDNARKRVLLQKTF